MEFFNPEYLIQYGGLTLLLVIIFAETGLFFGFFLPGDSLLFTAGLLVKTKYLDHHVMWLIVMLIIAAVTGTCAGYFFGRWTKRYIYGIKDNFLYKRKYLDMAQAFYAKHGLLSFIAGRFLPIFRTFVPIVAGVINIRFSAFLFFNVVGAALWIVTMVMSGHVLGGLFPAIINYIEIVIVAIVAVTTVPVILSYFKHRTP
jgi:membrane-associated protein